MTSHREAVRVELVDTDAGGRIRRATALRRAERVALGHEPGAAGLSAARPRG